MKKIISIFLVIVMSVGMAFSMPLALSADDTGAYCQASGGADHIYDPESGECVCGAKCEHSFVEETVIAPSCEEVGYSIFTCSVCRYSYEKETAATGHFYEVAEVISPECDKEGYSIYVCRVCTSSYEGDVTEPTGHDYHVIETVSPECQNGGYTTYACYFCGNIYESDFTEPLGHNYYAVETVPAGCTYGGYTTYACYACGHIFEDDVTAPLGHDYHVVEEAEPDCETAGYAVYACFNCGSFYEEEIAPLGHSFDSATGKCPCGEECPHVSYTDGMCDRCGMAEPTDGGYTVGDVNGDSVINGKDSNVLKKIISGAVSADGELVIVCDMFKDGSINGMDANLLSRYIAGEIAGF